MQQLDIGLNGGTGMKQLRIYYEKVGDEYQCLLEIAEPGKPGDILGDIKIPEEHWEALPGMFAHNTVLRLK